MRHLTALQSLRAQRCKALQEALQLRAEGTPPSLRSYLVGLIAEVRALDMAISYAVMSEVNGQILETLTFYADPETYFAIGFFPDPPSGEFMGDFSDTPMGFKPGNKAREALTLLKTHLRRAHKR